MIIEAGRVVAVEWFFEGYEPQFLSIEKLSLMQKQTLKWAKEKFSGLRVGVVGIVSATAIAIAVFGSPQDIDSRATPLLDAKSEKQVSNRTAQEYADSIYRAAAVSSPEPKSVVLLPPPPPKEIKKRPSVILDTPSNVFKTFKQVSKTVDVGDNLTLLRRAGKVHKVELDQSEIEANTVAVYKYIKKNYENDSYAINALAKTAQILYETGRFSSVLFNYASNVAGQKCFGGSSYVLSLDDKMNCVAGEYPYSRFVKFNTPFESIDYGCKKILQKRNYDRKNNVYQNPFSWIEAVYRGGYAVDSRYVRAVTEQILFVKKVLKKHGL